MKRSVTAAAGVAALILSGSAMADIFSGGTGGAFNDATVNHSIPGSGVFTSTLNVGSGGSIVNFNSITLTGLSHTWVGDLQLILTSPSGTNVTLLSRLGATTATSFGNSNDLSGNYTFVDSGGLNFSATGAVPAGTYNRSVNQVAAVVQVGADGATQGINNNPLSIFNGQSVTGVWTLTVRDYAGGDVGSLVTWSFDATIPAPGALALLGLAGLVGGRRRRN